MNSNFNNKTLDEISSYVNEKINISELNNETYISTENMLPNKAGVVNATTLPSMNLTSAFKVGDVLVSNIRPYFKKIWHATFDGGCSNDVLVFRTKKGFDSKFLYYVLSDDNFFDYSMSTSKGTKMPRGDKKALLEYQVPNLQLETQQKIAKVLSAIDDKIELNNKINENLEQQAQAIFKSWFVDFEPFCGKMPDDWSEGVLSDIVDFMNGYAFKSSELLNTPDNNCYDIFKQGHINRGGGFNINGTKSWFPANKAMNLEKYILKKGDILMAMTDMKDNVAILGNTALMEVDNKYIVNQRVGLLRCRNEVGISYPYVYILTNSSDFLTDLRKRANSGVQVNLSSIEIKNSEIIIAPKEINQKFDNIVKPLFEQIFNNDIEIQKLTQLRDTLLPKLMSGEIDVDKVGV